MRIGETLIDDTFAEAFPVKFVRMIVTAHDDYWLQAAVREFTGYSASVIACDAETGVERWLSGDETPDGRTGVSLLVFGFSAKALSKAVPNRAGQCIMTCPTTAAFDGMDGDSSIPFGKHMRFFGDGFQKSKVVGEDRYWRIPVMDGEFLVEESLTIGDGVGGGNIIIQGADQLSALDAARRASEAVAECTDVIAPFPGGVARSGSKVGSRYKGLPASTSDAYCPTLRGRTETKLHEDANCVYEVVIDGTTEEAVANAMATAARAAVGDGIVMITAGNYGGKLGKYHFQLRECLG